MQDCSAFTSSLGVKCVSYDECDEQGTIMKDFGHLIDVRFGGDSKETNYSQLYCPGKMEICCKDMDFVSMDSVIEEIFEKHEEHEDVHESNFHLMHEKLEIEIKSG